MWRCSHGRKSHDLGQRWDGVSRKPLSGGRKSPFLPDPACIPPRSVKRGAGQPLPCSHPTHLDQAVAQQLQVPVAHGS